MSLDPAIDATLRALLALLLASAAVRKLAAPADFRAAVRDYRIVPEAAGGAVAAGLVAAEMMIAAALAVPSFRTSALVAAATLLLVYAAAIATNLARGRAIDCGCGGPAARRPISGWLVVRNGIFAAVALMGTRPLASRPLVWVDALTIVAATAGLALLYAAADHLLRHAPMLEEAA